MIFWLGGIGTEKKETACGWQGRGGWPAILMVVFGNRTKREGKVNDVEVNSYGFIAGDVEPEFRKDENNAARVSGASVIYSQRSTAPKRATAGCERERAGLLATMSE